MIELKPYFSFSRYLATSNILSPRLCPSLRIKCTPSSVQGIVKQQMISDCTLIITILLTQERPNFALIQTQLTSEKKNDFGKNYDKMPFDFATKSILILLLFLAVSNSQQNETLDLEQILTEQNNLLFNISRCISYRYVPCELEHASDFVLFEESEEHFLIFEKKCISYRYIPCQDGWNALTMVYENEKDFLQRENARTSQKSWQCQTEQIREKNESGVLLKRLDEENKYLELNLTQCVNEGRNQVSQFESEIASCHISNQSLQENMVISETKKNTLKSGLDWCISDGENQTSSSGAEMQKCHQINLFLSEANFTCNSEKMKTQSNYSRCTSEGKNESMQFEIDFKNCQDQRDSISLRFSNCESENKEKELNLIDCQSKMKNKTSFYETELENCQNLSNSSDAQLLSCETKHTKMESNLTECLKEGQKTTLRFQDEIENYQALNNSLSEKIHNCQTEKNYILSYVAKCSNEVLNRSLVLESQVDQLQTNNTVLNEKILLCNSELARATSNFTKCLNDQNTTTLWFQTEMKRCQDARRSVDVQIVACETEKKQLEVNLTRCLIETENDTVEWFSTEGKKFELLTGAHNETAFACSVKKQKLESNLTECLMGFHSKIKALEEEIRKYQSLNYSLSEQIVTCHKEKAELATQTNGCLLEASNITKLLEAAINQYQTMSVELNANAASCNTEKTTIMSKLMTCLSEQQKRTTLSPIEQWNREKNLLVDYMASWWFKTSFPIVYNPPSYDSINVYVRYNTVRLELFPLTEAEKLKPEYGAVINDVLSFEYNLDIPSCSFPPSIRSIFIAVITQAENFERRHEIRYTFASYIRAVAQRTPPILIDFGFFMGQPESSSTQTRIEEESYTFSDIVQINMDDSNRNSPLKMAAVLNWVNRNCAKVDLVFKMEEEAKITIFSMANFLRNTYTSTNSMFGKPGNTIPVRGI